NIESESVTVLLGDGAGHFTPRPGPSFSSAGNVTDLDVGDFNNDGKPDLLLPVENFNAGTAQLHVVFGDGTRNFTAGPVTQLVSNFPGKITVSRFNADGNDDVAVINSSTNNVDIYTGDGAGHFSHSDSFAAGSFPDAVVTADFNGDGIKDLAIAAAFDNQVR